MSLDDYADRITPELKEKAKSCQSPEEMLDLARQEGIELTPEELESVSGGSWDLSTGYGDEREDVDESLVPESFVNGEDLGDVD